MAYALAPHSPRARLLFQARPAVSSGQVRDAGDGLCGGVRTGCVQAAWPARRPVFSAPTEAQYSAALRHCTLTPLHPWRGAGGLRLADLFFSLLALYRGHSTVGHYAIARLHPYTLVLSFLDRGRRKKNMPEYTPLPGEGKKGEKNIPAGLKPQTGPQGCKGVMAYAIARLHPYTRKSECQLQERTHC